MKRLHLICNAHIDPVWQWQRREGISTALATFAAAADFCEQYDNFVFCHNEIVLYRWVEKYDRPLFERIAKLVQSKKWHIMGGWYLQPDCNMPCGESFIRQIKRGLSYLKQKFPDVARPTVAVNVDSFGHTKGLVQILRDAGYTGYVCMRPHKDGEGDRRMLWKGFADTQIPVYRLYRGYNTFLGQAEQALQTYLQDLGDNETGLFFWGVGNHGGGPSRTDYRAIENMRGAYKTEFVHSTPEAYFAETANNPADEVKELNPVFQGCYTSMIRIKQLHQKLENELELAEKMAAHAALSGGTVDHDALDRAEEDLLFCQFHDVLPGTCIQSAEQDAIRQLCHGLEEVERVKEGAFFRLIGGQPRAAEGEYPIFVYNPHPFVVTRDVVCEYMLADQNRSDTEVFEAEAYFEGKRLPLQSEKEESNVALDWRKRVVFALQMQPFSVNRVSLYLRKTAKKERAAGEIRDTFRFDNGRLSVCIDGKTGLISHLSADGKEYLLQSGTLQVIQSACDPWGFTYNEYREKLGEFSLLDARECARTAGVAQETLCPVRIIEDGEVRTVVEAMFGYGDSKAVVRYTLPKSGTAVGVHIVLYNAEKDAKLKFGVNTAFRNGKLRGKTAFGRNDLPATGEEVAAQDYVLYGDGRHCVSVVHFGTYGLSARDGAVNFTLLNSAAYCAHPFKDRTILRQDRFGARMDMGERTYDFEMNFSAEKEREENIENESKAAHQPPVATNCFPTGGGAAAKPFIRISQGCVSLSSVRRKENGDTVLRLYNSVDRDTETKVTFGTQERKVTLKGYQFRTFLIGENGWTECNCLEETKGNER